MGFCLLECALEPGFYIAVNPEHVRDIDSFRAGNIDFPACIVTFSIDVAPFLPVVKGGKDQIKALMMRALRIGMNKVNLDILSGNENQSQMPLLLNNPGRIVLVREMDGEEFLGEESASMTASQMFFAEGMSRVIVQRPGVFARHVNADGIVPMIDSL